MRNDAPEELSRGLLGYRRSSVNQMIADRDIMLRQAEGRVRAAESKVSKMESDMAAMRDQNAQLAQQIEQLRGELQSAPRAGASAGGPGAAGRQKQAEMTNKFLGDELSRILATANESATRIVERAHATTRQQVEDADRMWRESQAQVARFAAWRERVDPVMRSAQAKIDEVRSRIEDVPDQIRQALAPLADSIAGLDTDLADVNSVSNPPLLVTPGGERGSSSTRSHPALMSVPSEPDVVETADEDPGPVVPAPVTQEWEPQAASEAQAEEWPGEPQAQQRGGEQSWDTEPNEDDARGSEETASQSWPGTVQEAADQAWSGVQRAAARDWESRSDGWDRGPDAGSEWVSPNEDPPQQRSERPDWRTRPEESAEPDEPQRSTGSDW